VEDQAQDRHVHQGPPRQVRHHPQVSERSCQGPQREEYVDG
jgi:hypothetical protein